MGRPPIDPRFSGPPQAVAAPKFIDRYGREMLPGDFVCAPQVVAPVFTIESIVPDLRPNVPPGAVRVVMRAAMDFTVEGSVPQVAFLHVVRPAKAQVPNTDTPDGESPNGAPAIKLTD